MGETNYAILSLARDIVAKLSEQKHNFVPKVDILYKHLEPVMLKGSFDDDDIADAIVNASKEQLDLTILKLTKKELVDFSVNDEGEFIFFLSEKGRRVAERL